MFIGPQLRRAREERGLTQAALARLIEISPSYLNQIERNQRPLSVAVLLRLGAALDFDVRTLSEDEGGRLVADLHAALTDPASGVADGIGTDEIRELVAGFPAMARAIVSLHRRATDARRRVEEMAVGLGGRLPEGASLPVMPYDEVLDFVYDNRNHFAGLDVAAEALARDMDAVGGGRAAALERLLAERHDVRTVVVDDLSDRRRYDPAARLLALGRGLDEGRRAFQMAAQYAYLAHGDVLARLTDVPGLSGDESRSLARIGLASYFAGAVLLPYRAFLVGGGGGGIRRRPARRALRRQRRDRLPPPEHPAASGRGGRAVRVRARGPRRQHLQAPLRHRLPLLAHRRDLPAVERLRGVLVAGPLHHPGGADARRAHLPLGRVAPSGAAPGATARRPPSSPSGWGATCVTRRAWSTRAAWTSATRRRRCRSAPGAGSASGSDARSAPSPSWGGRSTSTRIAAAASPTRRVSPRQAGGQRSSGGDGGIACSRRRRRPGSPAS